MTRAKRAAGALTLCLLLLACCLCAAGCTEEKTEEPTPGVTLTALEQTYTGEALYPVVTVTPTDLSDVRLKFYRDGEEVSAMVDAGEYRVVAEVQNGAIPDEEAEFVIRKATIDLAAVELPAKQYDGTTAYARLSPNCRERAKMPFRSRSRAGSPLRRENRYGLPLQKSPSRARMPQILSSAAWKRCMCV